jgi:site-specific DNA-methyltransferase (cytosine-N4-specific)
LKPYIQPFERRLALAELRTLAGAEPCLTGRNGGRGPWFRVVSQLSPLELANKLAYWECVAGSQQALTVQVLREATANGARNGFGIQGAPALLPFADPFPLPNKRCLRYGPHGVHEYRGKFFPQLVRALINIADPPRNGIVADPMCGSGTTLVEGLLAGRNSLGIDLNPLSAFMARAKCALMFVSPERLVASYQRLRDELLSGNGQVGKGGLRYLSSLSIADQAYLRKWFSEQVLLDLDAIAQLLTSLKSGPIRDLMWLSLSNILRAVSWQKKDDLRVRKEVRPFAEIDTIREFLEELERSVGTVSAFLYQGRTEPLGSFQVDEGDARTMRDLWKAKGIDMVVTSPPYATALPYLDTDRLSLIYLGLLSRPQHRRRESGMIGNREVTDGWRKAYWQHFQAEKTFLPGSVSRLIEKIAALNAGSGVGFRRRNLASLLAKYFLDMRQVLSAMAQILKTGARAYVVVGNNHTVAGGERVNIDTANLLAEIADSVRLKPADHIKMEMLVSRDIFKRNAVASETILAFRCVAQR